MKLRMIIETVQDQLTALAGRHGVSPEEVRSICQKISKKRWKWVLIQWYDGKISLPEDEKSVATALSNFEKVFKNLTIDQRNILQYQSLKEVEETVNPLLGVASSKKKHKFEGLEGVRVVNKNGPYVTVEVTDPESLGALGEGTKWCTRNSFPDCQKYKYIGDYGHIFIVFQNGKPVMQYTPDYEEIQDVDAEDVTDEELLSLIPPPELKEGNARVLYWYAHDVLKKEWSEAEPYIMKDPESAYWYALRVMNVEKHVNDPWLVQPRYVVKRWPEAEPYIMKDPESAWRYAKNVLKRRWPEAERLHLNDPKWVYNYALYVMDHKERQQAEPYIAKDPELALKFARDILMMRSPEAERLHMEDPKWAYRYTLEVINRNKNYRERERWPEAEPYIMKDPESAFLYAHDVMGKKRWPEAEPYIKQDQQWAFHYAYHIMKGKRLPEAEPYIMKDPANAIRYAKHNMKKRWREAELLYMEDPEWACKYAHHVMKGKRWPEAEPYIMKDPQWAFHYAHDVMGKERWPEAEPYIMKNPKWAFNYVGEILKRRWPEAEPYIRKSEYYWENYLSYCRGKKVLFHRPTNDYEGKLGWSI